MKTLLLATLLGTASAACHRSDALAADTPPDAPPACEKDLSVPFSKRPYCLSAEWQGKTLHDVVVTWCRETDATVQRADCGAYTSVSRHGDPSAYFHGSERLYFDKSGYLVGRSSSSNEWGARTEGLVPDCTVGPETDACATGQ